MSGFRHERIENIPARHKEGGTGYACERRSFLPRGEARQLIADIYEIPPGKSACPYHYHCMVEEIFYIISGSGVLRTPEGERRVSAGELLFFPADESGAHKLTNDSSTETLVYLDVDTVHALDAAVYPDSGKIGVWGSRINALYKLNETLDYYEGE